MDPEMNDDDYGLIESDDSDADTEQNCVILDLEQICNCQEDDIRKISTLLSLSRAYAIIVLRHHSWNVDKVQTEWFNDEENFRREVGILDSLEGLIVQDHIVQVLMNCTICLDTYTSDQMHGVACGHLYCRSCWIGYVASSINDGPGCLMLRCPHPSCGAVVGQDMINLFASDDDRQKYSHFLLRSYIEFNRQVKWCPAPGCNYAISFDIGSASYDVVCSCKQKFCWNCTEEPHSPLDCNMFARWKAKSLSQTEKWIIANSKPCPKCKRSIEKSQGCMHMTCTPPCNFQFCWLCLEAWEDHGGRPGGYNACNKYTQADKKGEYDEIHKKVAMAKAELRRYGHYYERWATNKSSMEKAMLDLEEMQSLTIVKLMDKHHVRWSQLKFITEAWGHIIECRRLLIWTYAYGYFLSEQEEGKRQFFEYLQGEAESRLEWLHQCAEELQWLDKPAERFNDFALGLRTLSRVTRRHF